MGRSERGTGSRGQGSLAPQRQPVLSLPLGIVRGASAERCEHTTSERGRDKDAVSILVVECVVLVGLTICYVDIFD